MARIQTRRSISVNRDLYERLKAYCEDGDVSMSSTVEAAVRPHLDKWEREQAGKK